MIMYSPGLVVDCSRESAGRENSSGYSFVVNKVRSGSSLRGLFAPLAPPEELLVDDDELELPAGLAR